MPGRRRSPIVTEGPQAALAQRLRALRDARALTLKQLSDRAGYSRAALAAAEAGRHNPTWALIAAFVGACDADPDEWRQLWEFAAEQNNPAARTAPTPDVSVPIDAPGGAPDTMQDPGPGAGPRSGLGPEPGPARGLVDEPAPVLGLATLPSQNRRGWRLPGRSRYGWGGAAAGLSLIALLAVAPLSSAGNNRAGNTSAGFKDGNGSGTTPVTTTTSVSVVPASDGTDPYVDHCKVDEQPIDWQPVRWPDGSIYGTLRLMHSLDCHASWGYVLGPVSRTWVVHIVAHRDPDGHTAPSDYSGDQPLPGSWGNVLSTSHGCVYVEAYIVKGSATGPHARTACFEPEGVVN